MMNQEKYVRVHELRKQGWTLGEIAAETGFHPATISKQLRARADREGVGDHPPVVGLAPL